MMKENKIYDRKLTWKVKGCKYLVELNKILQLRRGRFLMIENVMEFPIILKLIREKGTKKIKEVFKRAYNRFQQVNIMSKMHLA